MANSIEIQNLIVKYPFRSDPAVNSVSLNFQAGGFYVILGANGSGKSTLLKCIAGMLNWKSGSIYIAGKDRSQDYVDFNGILTMASEDVILPDFKVSDLFNIQSKIWPKFDRSTAERILGYSEISLDKKPSHLSRGQSILLQVAMCLGTRARIILIDEVTAALDPFVRRMVIYELNQYRKNNDCTVIMATNIATETQDIDCSLVLMRNGKVFKSGQYLDLKKHFIKRKVSFEDSLVANKDWVKISIDEKGITLISESSSDITEDSDGPVSIEEIFTYLTERGKR